MHSIIQKEKACYICGAEVMLEEHHVYGGPCRKLSERYGLKVYLCHYCHNEPPNGVHFNAAVNERLKAEVQQIAMDHYGWSVEDFRKYFRKSFI